MQKRQQAQTAPEQGLKSMGDEMAVLLFILLVFVVLLANSMILLRTARKPKIPKSVQPIPDDDHDDGW